MQISIELNASLKKILITSLRLMHDFHGHFDILKNYIGKEFKSHWFLKYFLKKLFIISNIPDFNYTWRSSQFSTVVINFFGHVCERK